MNSLSGKNSLQITFIMVYKGIAIIIPKMPKEKPAINMTRNISNGWELTLLEKMMG